MTGTVLLGLAWLMFTSLGVSLIVAVQCRGPQPCWDAGDAPGRKRSHR